MRHFYLIDESTKKYQWETAPENVGLWYETEVYHIEYVRGVEVKVTADKDKVIIERNGKVMKSGKLYESILETIPEEFEGELEGVVVGPGQDQNYYDLPHWEVVYYGAQEVGKEVEDFYSWAVDRGIRTAPLTRCHPLWMPEDVLQVMSEEEKSFLNPEVPVVGFVLTPKNGNSRRAVIDVKLVPTEK